MMKEEKVDLHLMIEARYHQKIKIASAECRLTMSEYCVNMILKGRVVARFSPSERLLLRNFQGAASNINQIAKALNKGHGDKITIAMAEDVVTKTNSLLDEFYKSKSS